MRCDYCDMEWEKDPSFGGCVHCGGKSPIPERKLIPPFSRTGWTVTEFHDWEALCYRYKFYKDKTYMGTVRLTSEFIESSWNNSPHDIEEYVWDMWRRKYESSLRPVGRI